MTYYLQLKVYFLNRVDFEGYEFLNVISKNVISKNSFYRLRYIRKKNNVYRIK